MTPEERISRLEDYVLADCRCPCCTDDKVCDEECTYREDSPDGYERMMWAREVMWDDH